jgi:hypothetical protein
VISGPVGNTAEFTVDPMFWVLIIQQILMLLLPVMLLVMVIKINNKLDSLLRLMQVRLNRNEY